jgi:hypothetical protein
LIQLEERIRAFFLDHVATCCTSRRQESDQRNTMRFVHRRETKRKRWFGVSLEHFAHEHVRGAKAHRSMHARLARNPSDDPRMKQLFFTHASQLRHLVLESHGIDCSRA